MADRHPAFYQPGRAVRGAVVRQATAEITPGKHQTVDTRNGAGRNRQIAARPAGDAGDTARNDSDDLSALPEIDGCGAVGEGGGGVGRDAGGT